jgi:uncharacterized protein YjbI with pentapeptide repeats
MLMAAVLAASISVEANAQNFACPQRPTSATGRNFENQVLTFINFSRLDLTNANFRGATLKGVSFIRANLTGADFSGATFVDPGNLGRSSDFSFARLDSACFIGAKFQAPTYFTYASLTSVDFSQTDLSNGNAIFGDQPLRFDAQASLRPSFRATVMNCEFVAAWNQFDLTRANIGACREQLQSRPNQPGHDFSGAQMAGVVFDGLDLTNSNWKNAVLENASFVGATLDGATGWSTTKGGPPVRLAGAVFNDASLKKVDFANAQLYGAQFTRANLENSRLQGALLSINPNPSAPVRRKANFDSAHLKNVDLSAANLDSASFRNANFYGSFNLLNHGPPAGFPCQLPAQSNNNCGGLPTGFTCSCATAKGADLTKVDFTGAFLYGADFGGGTGLTGTVFTNAVLVAANFNGARFSILDPAHGGAPAVFDGAYLQGADFTGVQLPYTSLTGAYVDVRPGGNVLQVWLPGGNTSFRGWKSPGTRVCVQADYSSFVTKAPITTNTTTCPKGVLGNCGPINPSELKWRSVVEIGDTDPPGYYTNPPTFGQANQGDPKCNAGKVDSDW